MTSLVAYAPLAQSNHEDHLLARSSSSGSSGLILTLHIYAESLQPQGQGCLPTSERWNVYGSVGRRNEVGPARGTTLHFYCDALAAGRLAILFPQWLLVGSAACQLS